MMTKRFGPLACRLAALLLIATSAATAARAQQMGEAAPAVPIARSAPAPANAVPEGTPVFVALKQTLRSGRARAGEVVAFEVVSDVRAAAADGQTVLISKGALAWGTVAESRGAGAFGRPGRLRITCDYVLLPNGTRVSLHAIGSQNNNKAAAAEAARSSNGGKGAAITLHASGRSRRGPATITMLVVGLPVYAVTYGLANLFGTNEDAFQGQVVPALVGVGSTLIVGSLWRGGNVTLPEGKTFAVEVAPATPPAPVDAPPPPL